MTNILLPVTYKASSPITKLYFYKVSILCYLKPVVGDVLKQTQFPYFELNKLQVRRFC